MWCSEKFIKKRDLHEDSPGAFCSLDTQPYSEKSGLLKAFFFGLSDITKQNQDQKLYG